MTGHRLETRVDGPWRSLRNRNFRIYFSAYVVSQIGNWVQITALIILVVNLTDDAVAIGLINAARFAPALLFSAWAGLLSDRLDRWKLVVVAQFVGLFVSLGLVVASQSEQPALLVIYGLAVAAGLVNTFESPARKSLISDILPGAEVGSGVGLSVAMNTSAKVLGPAIAGAIVAFASLPWAFALNGATYATLIALFMRMHRTQFQPLMVARRGPGQVRQGLRYAWGNRDIRLSLITVMSVGTLSFNFHVILPFFATRELGGTVTTFTLLFAFMGIGSVVGALWVASQKALEVRDLAWSAAAMAATTLVLATVTHRLLALVVIMLVGFTSVRVLAAAQALVQLRSEPQMRGRMLSLLTTVFLLTTPVGGTILGWMVERFGSRGALMLGAVVSAIVSIAVLMVTRGQKDQRNEHVGTGPPNTGH